MQPLKDASHLRPHLVTNAGDRSAGVGEYDFVPR